MIVLLDAMYDDVMNGYLKKDDGYKNKYSMVK